MTALPTSACPLPSPSSPYPLPPIPHLRLGVTLEARGAARLPPFKGSALRGAFGRALRRAVCVMGFERECAGCSLRRACLHTRLFEVFQEEPAPAALGGGHQAPRPYVFEPRDRATSYRPGEPLRFDLLLFGQAVGLEALARVALERMAAGGLGRERFPFRLAGVEPRAGAGVWRDPETALGERAVLRFLTPTRFKVSNRLLRDLDFTTFAHKALLRVLGLAHFHVPGEAIDWEIEPLLEASRRVRVTRRRLRWWDWQRYSHRQRTKMKLGGFVGEMEIAGDLAPLLPLLRAAEVVHVGKGTTFGLGRVEVGMRAL